MRKYKYLVFSILVLSNQVACSQNIKRESEIDSILYLVNLLEKNLVATPFKEVFVDNKFEIASEGYEIKYKHSNDTSFIKIIEKYYGSGSIHEYCYFINNYKLFYIEAKLCYDTSLYKANSSDYECFKLNYLVNRGTIKYLSNNLSKDYVIKYAIDVYKDVEIMTPRWLKQNKLLWLKTKLTQLVLVPIAIGSNECDN